MPHEFLDARILGETVGNARPVIAVMLLDAVAGGGRVARGAGCMTAFLGGAYHAIEFHRVALADLIAIHPAEIGLIRALAGNAIGDFAGMGWGETAKGHGQRKGNWRAHVGGASTHLSRNGPP